jgi:uncharacterized membrane protein
MKELQRDAAHQRLHFEKRRIEALADGIFAFAMTLLVLDLKQDFPKELSFSALGAAVAHKLFYYIITFIILGMYWTGHHAEFNYIKHTDRLHLWLNILILMFIAIMPFSTSLLGSSVNRIFAIFVYSCNITAITISYLLHWQYAISKIRLTDADLSNAIVTDVKKRLIVSNILLIFSLVVSLWSFTVSMLIYLIIQGYYILKTTSSR